MTKTIQAIKDICDLANSEYEFHYQSLLDENYLTQNKAVGDKFVFLEEQQSGFFNLNFHLTKTTNHVLYVCTLVDALETDNANKREVIREQMQNEFIFPFIKILRESKYYNNGQAASLPFEAPLPMFDNYAIVEILTFQTTEAVC